MPSQLQQMLVDPITMWLLELGAPVPSVMVVFLLFLSLFGLVTIYGTVHVFAYMQKIDRSTAGARVTQSSSLFK